MNKNEIEEYKKVGKIAKEVREYAKSIVKKDMLLIEIAGKIENKINDLGGKPAFPVNLSINEIAAHYHPLPDEKTKASGLLKIDIGVHVDGFIADTALSLDLTEDNRHKNLIESSEMALVNALKLLNKNPSLHEIGEIIQKTIESKGFSPVINLSGHSIEKYEVHAGIIIPNYGNNNNQKLHPGVYAIEPFSTYGEGKIYEGNQGNIYSLVKMKNVRSLNARRVLDYINENFKTLPFSLRDLHNKFGIISRLALKELENNGVIHSYPQLIEKSKKVVAQSEHTFIKTDDGEIIIITK